MGCHSKIWKYYFISLEWHFKTFLPHTPDLGIHQMCYINMKQNKCVSGVKCPELYICALIAVSWFLGWSVQVPFRFPSTCMFRVLKQSSSSVCRSSTKLWSRASPCSCSPGFQIQCPVSQLSVKEGGSAVKGLQIGTAWCSLPFLFYVLINSLFIILWNKLILRVK